MIINSEGHSCGTVTDDNNNGFLAQSFDLFHQCFTVDCPSMLLPKVIVCDKIFTFIYKVCFFFLVSPVLPFSFSRNEIPGKYKYSNI